MMGKVRKSIFFVGIALGITVYALTGWAMLSTDPGIFKYANVDFYTYYGAGVLFSNNQDIYDGGQLESVLTQEDLIYIDGSNYIYPPFLAALAQNLTSLGGRNLGFIWYITSFCLFFGAIWMAIQLLPELPLERKEVYLYSSLFFPTMYAFFVGQINTLILFCLVGILYFDFTKRSFLSTGLFAVAVLVKASPILLTIYFISSRKYKSLVQAFVLLFIVIVGVEIYYENMIGSYLITALNVSSVSVPHPANQSVSAFFSRLFVENEYTSAIVDNVMIARGLSVVSNLALLSYVLWLSFYKFRSARTSIITYFCIIIIIMIIISPLSWENIFILILFPIINIVSYWKSLDKQSRVILIVALVLMNLNRAWASYGETPAAYPDFIRHLGLMMSLTLYGAILLLYLHHRVYIKPEYQRNVGNS